MLRRLIDGLAAAGGALSASAWPSFLQQYRVGLASRIDELARVVGEAPRGGDAAAFVARQETRLTTLREALAQIDTGGPIARLAGFARGFDPDTARVAWDRFEPALQFGWSGAAHALAGALLGLALVGGVAWPARRIALRRRRERWT
jgi:hypothetical protein